MKTGTSLMVQWLRFQAFNERDAGSIPGWGTKIPHALWNGQKILKKKKILFKNEDKQEPPPVSQLSTVTGWDFFVAKQVNSHCNLNLFKLESFSKKSHWTCQLVKLKKPTLSKISHFILRMWVQYWEGSTSYETYPLETWQIRTVVKAWVASDRKDVQRENRGVRAPC